MIGATLKRQKVKVWLQIERIRKKQLKKGGNYEN